MSDTVKIRIGVQSARELELEVDDADAVVEQLEAGASNGGLVWVTDAKGCRHGVVTDKLVFVIVDAEEIKPGVGFST